MDMGEQEKESVQMESKGNQAKSTFDWHKIQPIFPLACTIS